jgi:hypothetical protein
LNKKYKCSTQFLHKQIWLHDFSRVFLLAIKNYFIAKIKNQGGIHVSCHALSHLEFFSLFIYISWCHNYVLSHLICLVCHVCIQHWQTCNKHKIIQQYEQWQHHISTIGVEYPTFTIFAHVCQDYKTGQNYHLMSNLKFIVVIIHIVWSTNSLFLFGCITMSSKSLSFICFIVWFAMGSTTSW